MQYHTKDEIIEERAPIVQLGASKLSIEDLFNEIKCFKYQTTVKILLKKYNLNEEIEFAPIYFNSVTKTVINHWFRLKNSFQEILYMIDVWINKGSGWNVESIESQYINISIYRSLSGSSWPTCWIKKSKTRINQHQKQRWKMFFMVSC